jgi:hypothetical protein
MSDLISAAKQSLEALEYIVNAIYVNSQQEADAVDKSNDAIKALEEALAKQEQCEPVGVAHLMQDGFTHCIWSEACVPVGTKFYTTPQQRKPLTNEEIWDLHIKMSAALNCKLSDLIELTRAVEAAHNIKE